MYGFPQWHCSVIFIEFIHAFWTYPFTSCNCSSYVASIPFTVTQIVQWRFSGPQIVSPNIFHVPQDFFLLQPSSCHIHWLPARSHYCSIMNDLVSVSSDTMVRYGVVLQWRRTHYCSIQSLPLLISLATSCRLLHASAILAMAILLRSHSISNIA